MPKESFPTNSPAQETQSFLKIEIRRSGKETSTLSAFEKLIANPQNYIDQGGAAKVYRLAEGICIKVMKNRHTEPRRHMYDLGNTVTDETWFMEKLSSVVVSGVRTPKPMGTIHSSVPGGMVAIIMDELPAVNLQHVIRGEQKMPEKFDYNLFFDSLEKYVNALHTEHRIAHGDLEARNVMVDKETGLPYVIDFGRAAKLELGENEETALEKKDWDDIEHMSQQVEKLTKSKNSD